MSLNRTTTWLVASILALSIVTPTFGQADEDMQWFANAELDQFGGGPRPNEGYFFSFEMLNWWVSRPEVTPVGFPNLTRTVYYRPSISKIQHNTLDNSWLENELRAGTRFEGGWVDGHHGMLFSGYGLHDRKTEFTATSVDMAWRDITSPNGQRFLWGPVLDVITDPTGGGADYVPVFTTDPNTGFTVLQNYDLPLHWDYVELKNNEEHWSMEANYLYRMHPTRHGALIELMAGVRYLEFAETYSVFGYGDRYLYIDVDPTTGQQISPPVGPHTILADSYWDTTSENRVVGPQFGFHWFKKAGRWTLSTDTRVFAGWNYQSLRQKGELGSRLGELPPAPVTFPQPLPPLPPVVAHTPYAPLITQPIGFTHFQHNTVFAPGVELRLEGKFQLTRALSIGAGYNVFWLDGIARAPNLVDYTISTSQTAGQNGAVLKPQVLGINNERKREDVFMHGPSLKLEFNR